MSYEMSAEVMPLGGLTHARGGPNIESREVSETFDGAPQNAEQPCVGPAVRK